MQEPNDTQTTVNDSETSGSIDTGLTQDRSAFVSLLPGLYRKARELPADQGGQQAYNPIELIEGDVMSTKPWGDHPLQQIEHLFRVQLEGLERALANRAFQ